MTTTEHEDRTITKELTFTLDNDGLARIAHDAASISSQLNRDRIEFKKIKTEWKDKIVGGESALSKLMEVIERGTETKMSECIERRKFHENKVEYIVDGKVIESRAMDAEERQMEIDPNDKTVIIRKHPRVDGRALAAGDPGPHANYPCAIVTDLPDDDDDDDTEDDRPANLPEPVEVAKENRLTDRED